jgi:hypothetical protein
MFGVVPVEWGGAKAPSPSEGLSPSFIHQGKPTSRRLTQVLALASMAVVASGTFTANGKEPSFLAPIPPGGRRLRPSFLAPIPPGGRRLRPSFFAPIPPGGRRLRLRQRPQQKRRSRPTHRPNITVLNARMLGDTGGQWPLSLASQTRGVGPSFPGGGEDSSSFSSYCSPSSSSSSSSSSLPLSLSHIHIYQPTRRRGIKISVISM